MIELMPTYITDLNHVIRDRLLRAYPDIKLGELGLSIYLDKALFKQWWGDQLLGGECPLLEFVNTIVENKIILLIHDKCILRVSNKKHYNNRPTPPIGELSKPDAVDYLFEINFMRVDDVLGFDIELIQRVSNYHDGLTITDYNEDGSPNWLFDPNQYLKFGETTLTDELKETMLKTWDELRGVINKEELEKIKSEPLVLVEHTFGHGLLSQGITKFLERENELNLTATLYIFCNYNAVKKYCIEKDMAVLDFNPYLVYGGSAIMLMHEGAYFHLFADFTETNLPKGKNIGYVKKDIRQLIFRLETTFDEDGYDIVQVATKIDGVWNFHEDIPYFHDKESWVCRQAAIPSDIEHFQNRYNQLFNLHVGVIMESITRKKS